MTAPAPFPTDLEQLRRVALAAEVFLRVDAARKYGFIDGGPDVDVDRCEEAIDYAADQGVAYTQDDIDATLMHIIGELTR